MSLTPNYVVINGVQVSADDPCELWQALYNYRLSLLGGGKVEEIEIRSPITTRRTKFGATNIGDLDAELERLSKACDIAKGRSRRARYAIRGRYTRPY